MARRLGPSYRGKYAAFAWLKHGFESRRFHMDNVSIEVIENDASAVYASLSEWRRRVFDDPYVVDEDRVMF